jgi:GTP cyclohydrolase I
MDIKHSDTEVVKNSIKTILNYIGEDVAREGLIETPERIIKSYSELFSGYKESPEDVLKVFEDGACDEMVVLKDIEFYSTCEHHFLPFFGKISIGYIPNGKVVGVSKLARLVEIYSRRLQIQERMTSQIADALDCLNPKGAAVICEAQHLCMIARGINKQRAKMITSAVRGAFKENVTTKMEFLKGVA